MDSATLEALTGSERFTALYELCLAGKSLSEVGKLSGCSKQAVWSYVRKYASEEQWQLLKDKWESKNLDHSKIESLLQAKEMKITEIADLCDCSWTTVKRIKSRMRKNKPAS
jgi:DNA invertase Pin-like site-specific DNA recombinase